MNFFQEFEKLRKSSPRLALVNIDANNSPYINYCYKNKSCYLIYASDYNEDSINCYFIYFCKDCVDCNYCNKCELCFGSTDCDNCYNCDYSQDCRNSYDLTYCYNCIGCKNCFGCINLREKEFYIFNERYSKDDYKKKIEALKKDPKEIIERKFEELKKKHPHIYMRQMQNENCTGDYIFNSKNCFFGFNVKTMEDSNYMNNCIDCKDSMDCSNIYHKNELCYQCVAGTYLYNCNFCSCCFESNDLEYCDQCYNCKHCFGCVYLKHKGYHILNKPYTKEKYEKKIAEIKEQLRREGTYGQFFPSTYPYEDSLAFTFWPSA